MEFWFQPEATRTPTSAFDFGYISSVNHQQRFAIAPFQGAVELGPNDAGVGVSIGTNGIGVYEHSAGYLPSRLVYDTSLNGWNHVAVVYKDKKPSLYLNGQLVASRDVASNYIVHPSQFLGEVSLSFSPGNPFLGEYGRFKGGVDEFRIWNKALTSTEIKANWQKVLKGNEAGLVAYWSFDEGQGVNTKDKVGGALGSLKYGATWGNGNIPFTNSFPGRRYTYDPVFNQLTSFTDDLGHKTLYKLDAKGNIASITQIVGTLDTSTSTIKDDLVTTMTYTANGLLDTVSDPLKQKTDYNYDVFGRLTQIIFDDLSTRSFAYDRAGNQTRVTDENGNLTQFQYDKLNRVTQITEADPDGPTKPLTSPITKFTYDAMGNLTELTDARGNLTKYQYDNLNRRTKTIAADPDGTGPLTSPMTSYSYDAQGNLTAMSDPRGKTTRYFYDERDRRTQMIDAAGVVTLYEYDDDDNLTKVIESGGAQPLFAGNYSGLRKVEF
jgi:YD repeat-containing protein